MEETSGADRRRQGRVGPKTGLVALLLRHFCLRAAEMAAKDGRGKGGFGSFRRHCVFTSLMSQLLADGYISKPI